MPILKIENLTKSFVAPDGAKHIIVALDQFSLESGKQLALAGESGRLPKIF